MRTECKGTRRVPRAQQALLLGRCVSVAACLRFSCLLQLRGWSGTVTALMGVLNASALG